MKKSINLLVLMLALPFMVLAQTARVQIIHNSADAAASNVDIYINESMAVPAVQLRTATEFLDITAGSEIQIDIVPHSMDISQSVFTQNLTLNADDTYVGIANGIVSTSGYTPAPAFGLDIYNMGQEAAVN